ncbi:MAG: phosphopantetheine-binding protein [Bryobacteraceae bacterium]
MSDEFAQRVIGAIAKSQHLPAETIKLESTFEELKIDSLDGINILFALESEFQVSIPDEVMKSGQLKTIGDLASGLHRVIESGEAKPIEPKPSPSQS